jgi:DNA-binding CsgD family transcriptional regulator
MAIYRLLGVRSRGQAVAAARQSGLLSEPMVPLGA